MKNLSLSKIRTFSFLFTISLASALTAFSPSAHAKGKGGGVSGGADFHIRTAAWFTTADSKRVVRACFEVAPGFGFPNDRLLGFVQEAFDKWVAYYNRVSPVMPEASAETRKLIREHSPFYWHRIATRLEIHAKCTGQEDLAFYFGTENELTRERAKKYIAPLGFSELRKPLGLNERQDAWSPGFIWIAPPKSVQPKESVPTWTNYDGVPLRSLLLHEIGHVFGNDHVLHTIMDPDLASEIAQKSNPKYTHASARSQNELVNIDSMSGVFVFKLNLARHAAVRPRAGDCLYTSGEGRKMCDAGGNYVYRAVFKRLTGREMVGPYTGVKMTIDKEGVEKLDPQEANTRILNPARFGAARISMADGAGEVKLKFDPVSIVASRVGVDLGQFRLPNGNAVYSDAVSIFGFLENPNGQKLPMIANYNMEYREFELIDPMLKIDEMSTQPGLPSAIGCMGGGSCPMLGIYNFID